MTAGTPSVGGGKADVAGASGVRLEKKGRRGLPRSPAKGGRRGLRWCSSLGSRAGKKKEREVADAHPSIGGRGGGERRGGTGCFREEGEKRRERKNQGSSDIFHFRGSFLSPRNSPVLGGKGKGRGDRGS